MVDTSFLTGPTPVPLLSPYEKQLRQNALAQQAMQLQGQQQAFSDQQATRSGLNAYYASQTAPAPLNALAPAAAPPPVSLPGSVNTETGIAGQSLPSAPAYTPPAPQVPAAAPAPPAAPAGFSPMRRPATPTVADLVNKFNVPPEAAAATVAAFQKVDAGAADIEKTHAETAAKQGELAGLIQEQGALASHAVIASGYNPAVIQHQLEHFSSLGPQYAQMAQQIAQHIQANPDQMPAIFQSMAAAGKGNREAGAAEATAQSKAAEVGNLTRTTDAKLLTEQRGQALSAIGASKDQASWTAAFADLPMELKAKLGPVFSPARATYAQQLGLSSQEQVTTAQAAANARQTASYQNSELGLSRARLSVEQGNAQVNRAAADPWGTLGINSHPMGGGGADTHGEEFLRALPPQLAATVKAVAEGRQTNLPRGGKELDQLMGAVNQYDPTYSVQRAQTRTAFQTGAQGKNIGNLNTAVVHLDQYHEVMKAMNNGTFQPGNQLYNWVAEKFGSAAVTNPDFVRQSLAGEAANALKGNATDPEIAGIMKTLGKNQSSAQQEGAAMEGLKILGTKLNTYDEQYHQVSPDDPWSPVLPTARAVFSRYKIQPLTRTGQAPEPGAGSSIHAVPDLGATFNGGKVLKVTPIK